MRRHVCLVGLDGLRIDLADRGAAPALWSLREAGSYHEQWMTPPTDSGPGWSTLLTGVSGEQHGVVDNSFVGNRLARHPDVLSRAYYADTSRSTFAAAGWPPLVDPADVGPVVATRDDQRRAGSHRVIVRDGEMYGYRVVDAELAAIASAHLWHSGPDVSFVYFCGADEAAHVYGARSPEYLEAITRVDELLGRLVTAIRHRVEECGEDWLLVVTTDHGHLDAGGHGGSEDEVRRSFVVRCAFGADLEPWPDVVDPTDLTGRLLEHLGG